MSLQHPILTFELVGIALALSKLLQVLLPFVFTVIGRSLKLTRSWMEHRAAREVPDGDPIARREVIGKYERRLGRLVGFFSWKIGCDLGFFLVTPHSLWQAFTLAGLIPYTIVQYCIYYGLGQKMVLSGMGNPFVEEQYRTPSLQRKKPMRRLLSMWLHEDLNSTSAHVPTRRIFLKPFVDFGAVVLSWSLYTVGLFIVESGEFTLAPLQQFPIAEMLGMYVGGTLAFIIGYNLGFGLYLLLARFLGERLWHHPAWMPEADSGWAGPFRKFRRPTRWRVHRFVKANGLTLGWISGVAVGIITVGLTAQPMAAFVRTSTQQAWQFASAPTPETLAAQRQLTKSALGSEAPPSDFLSGLRHYLGRDRTSPEENRP